MKSTCIVNNKCNDLETTLKDNVFSSYCDLEAQVIKAVSLSMYYSSIKNDAVLQEESRKLVMHAHACIKLFTKIWQLNKE